MAFEKLVSFTKDVSDLADKPSLTPAELKAQFDAAPDEVRVYLNKLIDALKLTTSGDSGAKNIGASTITSLTGSDVQTLLESLKSYADTTFAKKTQPAWNNFSFTNGAKLSTSTVDYPPQYRKNEFGKTEIRGHFVNGDDLGTGYVFMHLPVGYRPTKQKYFTMLSETVTYTWLIRPSDGAIYIAWCNGTVPRSLYFPDIVFDAEQ